MSVEKKDFHVNAHLAGRSDILPDVRVHPHDIHAVTFAVKRRNLDVLQCKQSF
jgi:hypothetical protein